MSWTLIILAGLLGIAISLAPIARGLFRGLISSINAMDRRGFAIPVVFAIALFIGAIPWLLGNIAPPSFHDEFAYLLGADTFAHGRLTNPTPKFSEHFETFHEIIRPTYQSKFPPGQSIALWIGQMLGAPIIGAFGSVALASAAAYWMLRAVLSARWAFATAILVAIHPLIFVWSQMYWGGGVPLIGSMLLIGSVLRIASEMRHDRGTETQRRRLSWVAPMWLGASIAIFLNTRLLEGAITCLIVFSWLLVASLRARQFAILIRCGVIALLPLIPTLAWMGYYNWRVTGHPLQLPYLLHTQQYMRAPLFTWEHELPRKTYPDERMRQFHEDYEVQEWRNAKQHFGDEAIRKIGEYLQGYGGYLLLPLLPVLPGLLRRSSTARFCTLVMILFPLLQIAISVYFRPHYAAPMTGCVIVLIGLALREWTRVRWVNRRMGASIATGVIATFVASCALTVWNDYGIENRRGSTRQRMIENLEHSGGRHLILVQYTPRPQQLFEWVYNSADIDGQKVIWARSLGEAKDRELLEHYKGRTQWKLLVDYNSLSPLQRLN